MSNNSSLISDKAFTAILVVLFVALAILAFVL